MCMSTRCMIASVALALAVAPVPAMPAPSGGAASAASITDLSWLAGDWSRAARGRVVEEHWMAPRGGLMLGMSRTTAGDSTVEHESMRIHEEGGRLVFTARPSGQPEASFTAIEVSSRRVVFEDLSHDFPQRVIYARGGGDSLVARIEGMRGGALRGMDFPMVRATPSNAAGSDAGASAGPTAATIAQLTRQADAWDRAIVRKDSLAIAGNMADDFRQIGRDGSVADRATFLSEIVDPKLTIDPYSVEDLDVRVYGDVALLCGRTRMTGRYDGKAFASHYRYIDTYVRTRGVWKVCSVQITAVAD